MPRIIKSPVFGILGLLCAGPAFGAAAVSAQPQPSAVLSSILHPPLKIVDAAVLDTNGATIGTVARIEVSPAGVPLAVAITPAGKPDQVKVLDAGALAYDASKNQLIDRGLSHG